MSILDFFHRTRLIWIGFIVIGVFLILTSALLTPQIASRYFSPDHYITSQGLEYLGRVRGYLVISGLILSIIGGILLSLRVLTGYPKILDILIVLTILAVTLIYAHLYMNFSVQPMEDAGILMRYAQHFSEGYGIVWNVGEKPVDGATDFLLVIVLGWLTRAGLPLEAASRVLGFISHGITVALVYFAIRWLYPLNQVSALFSSVFIALGPGLYYVAAYFGTPFFALFALLTWIFALLLIKDVHNSYYSYLFACSGLITGLIRPEGVLLASLMLISVIYCHGFKKTARSIFAFLLIFAVFGGAYFYWRWQYFGYPLPNPYYKKGAGLFYTSSMKDSFVNTLNLCLPFVLFYLLGLRNAQMRRFAVALVLPVLGFTMAFGLITDDTNFGYRFQYAMLPIVLISWPQFLVGIKPDYHLPNWFDLDLQKRVTLVVVIILLAVGALLNQFRYVNRLTYNHDGRYEVAQLLAEYGHQKYKLATTEAGILPLYSDWQTLDTWGLNDPWIAHHGGITREYLDQYKPDVVVFHAYGSPLVPFRGPKDWNRMVKVLKNYSEEHGYILAAIFGESPSNTHYYYVSPSFPYRDELVEKLSAMNYSWWESGRRAINYALIDIK